MSVQTFVEPVFKPSVQYQPHKNLEIDVKEYLEGMGFVVTESTYHSVLDDSTVRLLQYRFTPTALYVRGRADRLAMHKTRLIDFEWEVKTHYRKDKHDLTIEALPLMHHMIKSYLGVNCLYVFCVNGMHGGFWVGKNMPKIKTLWIPPRKEYDAIAPLIKHLAPKLMPETNIVEYPVNGSGDPFVIFSADEIAKTAHWQKVISNLMEMDY